MSRAAAQTAKKSEALNEAVKRLRTAVNSNRPPASPARLLSRSFPGALPVDGSNNLTSSSRNRTSGGGGGVKETRHWVWTLPTLKTERYKPSSNWENDHDALKLMHLIQFCYLINSTPPLSLCELWRRGRINVGCPHACFGAPPQTE